MHRTDGKPQRQPKPLAGRTMVNKNREAIFALFTHPDILKTLDELRAGMPTLRRETVLDHIVALEQEKRIDRVRPGVWTLPKPAAKKTTTWTGSIPPADKSRLMGRR